MIQDQALFAVVRPSVSVFNADQQGLRRGPQTFGKLLEPMVEFGSGEPSYDWGFKRRSGSGDRRYFRYARARSVKSRRWTAISPSLVRSALWITAATAPPSTAIATPIFISGLRRMLPSLQRFLWAIKRRWAGLPGERPRTFKRMSDAQRMLSDLVA